MNTVVADNQVTESTYYYINYAPDYSGEVTVSGNDLIGDSSNSDGFSSANGDLLGGNGNPVLDPLLSLLGNYGGSTQTIALLPGSPALGAGEAIPDITTDQRGISRPSSSPDIGAFQSQGFTLTVNSGASPQSTDVGTDFANPLGVTVSSAYGEPVVGGAIAYTVPSPDSGAAPT